MIFRICSDNNRFSLVMILSVVLDIRHLATGLESNPDKKLVMCYEHEENYTLDGFDSFIIETPYFAEGFYLHNSDCSVNLRIADNMPLNSVIRLKCDEGNFDLEAPDEYFCSDFFQFGPWRFCGRDLDEMKGIYFALLDRPSIPLYFFTNEVVKSKGFSCHVEVKPLSECSSIIDFTSLHTSTFELRFMEMEKLDDSAFLCRHDIKLKSDQILNIQCPIFEITESTCEDLYLEINGDRYCSWREVENLNITEFRNNTVQFEIRGYRIRMEITKKPLFECRLQAIRVPQKSRTNLPSGTHVVRIPKKKCFCWDIYHERALPHMLRNLNNYQYTGNEI